MTTLIWLSDRREQLVDEIEAFVRATAPEAGPNMPRALAPSTSPPRGACFYATS
jgi:hypothetical protein